MKIKYNIKSYGTEKDSDSDGYMAVSEINDKCQYIMPISHNIKQVESIPVGSLMVDAHVNIATIAVSRFVLISKLALDKIDIGKSDNILVCGCGCVGFAALLYLSIRGLVNVEYTSMQPSQYNANKWVSPQDVNWDKYNIIIDATGCNEILENIFNYCKILTKIIILGTPRHKPDVDILKIHRKNLVVYGGHELFGYSLEQRQRAYNETITLIDNSKIDCCKVCEIVDNFTLDKNCIYQIRKNF